MLLPCASARIFKKVGKGTSILRFYNLTIRTPGNVDIVAKKKHSALGKHTSIKKPPYCSTD